MFLYILYSFYHEVSGRADQTRKGIFFAIPDTIQFALKEVLGLKGAVRISAPCPRREELILLYLWTSLAITVPGRTFPAVAVPYPVSSSLGITALGTVEGTFTA